MARFPTDLWHQQVDRAWEESDARVERNLRGLRETMARGDEQIRWYDNIRERVRAKLPRFLDYETALVADMTVNQLRMFIARRYTPESFQIERLARHMRIR